MYTKIEINSEMKKMLDEMHRQKIDMSDEIYVINVADILNQHHRINRLQHSQRHQALSTALPLKEIFLIKFQCNYSSLYSKVEKSVY